MRRCLIRLLALATFLTASSLAVFGQGGATAPLTGIVLDQSGAAVSGAVVIVKNNATGAESNVTTAGNGTYTVPALGAGTYTVTVEAAGFKKAVLQEVKIDVGVAATANVTLEIGATSESVVVEGAGEILQTQSANVSTTIQTKQISQLPLQSRNTIYFLTMLPGVSSAATASPRNSTVNGLPSTAYNITIDGLNTQDNLLKSTDGFFSFISPSVDAIQEVTLSTATPGSESAGQGAIQIKFATRSGTNEYHGSLYEYHRNTVLNSNYWFTNRDVPYDRATAKICDGSASGEPFDPNKCKAQRAPNLFNQFGGRIGGPISIPKLLNGKDRAFFFVNFEEFRQPNSITRTRTILSPDAQAGIFKFTGGPAGGVNLLTLGGQTATIDPTINKLLNDIRSSTANAGGVTQSSDPNLQTFTFNNTSMGRRYFPTVRLDFNLSSKHSLSNTYNYQSYVTTVDTLNNVDPAFPGFLNHGGQFSNRFADSVTLRSTLTPRLVNEARVGLTGGTVLFFPEVNSGQFANYGGFNLGGAPGNGSTGVAAALGINGPTVSNSPERRNAPVWDFADSATWTRGAHSISFGGQFTQASLFISDQTIVPTLNFGIDNTDPAASLFAGLPSSVQNSAKNLYAVLTGRVSSINANAVLNETTNQYQYLGNQIRRGRQREWGFFGQDSWRATPNLTITGGLRYELQLPFSVKNGIYSTTTTDALFGIAGPGNLFNPNQHTGSATQFVQFKDGDQAYKTDKNNFAPSVGFAWGLPAKNGWLKRITGEGGQTVIRGGYSIAYERQGSNTFLNFDVNPGFTFPVTRNVTNNNLFTTQCPVPILLSQTSCLGPAPFANSPSYPVVAGTSAVSITSSAFVFDPHIQTPYAQSFTLGIQREITKDMAFEVRYVHTRNLQTWLNYNLNEVNIVENGFLNEFKLAQKNLQANIAAGKGNTFAYTGAPGTSPLPIYFAFFQGRGVQDPNTPNINPGDPNLAVNYKSGNWSATNFTNPLAINNPNPYAPASSSSTQGLYGSGPLRNNALAAGLSPNFFVPNPDLLGGVFVEGNGGFNNYNGLQVEFRRRLSKGLLVEGNYTFAKSLTAQAYSFRDPRFTITTFTNGGGNTGTNTGGTLAHAFKANWSYELPIGKGKMLLGSPSGFTRGVLDKVVGGWEWYGTARVQSGSNIDMGNVRLVGMTRKDLQNALNVRQGLIVDSSGNPTLNKQGLQTPAAYYLPQDIIENTIRAFNVSATSATGYGPRGVPLGRYIAPANNSSCIQVVRGDCGFTDLFITGPKFVRFDMSAVKRFRFTERMNFEFRAEFLNAFNNINFLYPTAFAANTTTFFGADTFGQVTAGYRDVNNTQDPGGRLIQLVGRFNF